MSLILDALNRSRQDADPVPGLATQHPVEHITIGVRHILPWLGLLLALILIAWLVWDRRSAPEPGVTDIGAPVAELSRNIGSAVTSVTTELKARAVVETPPESPTAVDEPLPEPVTVADAKQVPEGDTSTAGGVAQKADAVEAKAATTTEAANENPAVAELYQKQEREPVKKAPTKTSSGAPSAAKNSSAANTGKSRAVQEESVDIEAVLRQAQEELQNAELTAHSAPFLAELSQQVKNGIPTIYYQRHDYASQASQSAVVLNGKTLKVGGSPAAGVKVDEILPDSVVLSVRGTQFRLRALNSWVNL